MSWNTNQTGDTPVTVLLAGPKTRTDIWQRVFGEDLRFRVTTIANTPEDLMIKLISDPEVILMDAAFFGNPESFTSTITQFQNATYVVLPQIEPADEQQVRAELGGMQQIKGIYSVDVHLQTLVEKIFGDAQATKMAQSGQSQWGVSGGNGQRPVTARIITVWNIAGGVGKTTVSTNLASMASRRGYPTLLVGMGAPDDLPLILGLGPKPNLAQWQNNPTPDGLRLISQKVGSMNVVAGFPDSVVAGAALSIETDKPGSFKSLVETAIREYDVIVIDAPPSAEAALALAASNYLVLVGRPSTEGAMRTVEAYRTVFERMLGMHSLSPSNAYLVLNRLQSGRRLDARSWHKMAAESVQGGFLPLMSQIPDLPEVGNAQDERVLPLDRSEAFRQALAPLADALFADAGTKMPDGRVKNILGVKVRF